MRNGLQNPRLRVGFHHDNFSNISATGRGGQAPHAALYTKPQKFPPPALVLRARHPRHPFFRRLLKSLWHAPSKQRVSPPSSGRIKPPHFFFSLIAKATQRIAGDSMAVRVGKGGRRSSTCVPCGVTRLRVWHGSFRKATQTHNNENKKARTTMNRTNQRFFAANYIVKN